MERTKPRWIRASGARRARLRGAAWGLGGALLVEGAAAWGAAPTSLPSDGSVAFVYSKAAAVTGCSQRNEVEVRDLIEGVVHQDPFVPAGKSGAFALRVDVTAAGPGVVRAAFALFDKDGGSLGVSQVEDPTCDGAHLKLAASIALLLQPRPASMPVCPECPEAECDPACRKAVRIAMKDEVAREVRAEELPKLQEEARRAAEGRSPPEPAWRPVLAAGGLIGLELAADPAPGFWLAGEVRSSRWSFGLEARGLFPTRVHTLAGGATVDLAGTSGVLSPCVRWRWLSGCALVELGGLWVAGPGVPGGGATGVLFGLGGRGRVDVPLAAGLEARVFGDVTGHVLGFAGRGTDEGGAYTFDAPRRVSAFVGVGLAKVF